MRLISRFLVIALLLFGVLGNIYAMSPAPVGSGAVTAGPATPVVKFSGDYQALIDLCNSAKPFTATDLSGYISKITTLRNDAKVREDNTKTIAAAVTVLNNATTNAATMTTELKKTENIALASGIASAMDLTTRVTAVLNGITTTEADLDALLAATGPYFADNAAALKASTAVTTKRTELQNSVNDAALKTALASVTTVEGLITAIKKAGDATVSRSFDPVRKAYALITKADELKEFVKYYTDKKIIRVLPPVMTFVDGFASIDSKEIASLKAFLSTNDAKGMQDSLKNNTLLAGLSGIIYQKVIDVLTAAGISLTPQPAAATVPATR